MARPPLPERTAKAAGSGPEPEANRPTPMDRFRSLAQRLVSVSRADIAEKEAKEREEATGRKR